MTVENRMDFPRWQDYVLDHGKAVNEFWKSHLRGPGRGVLFVLGKGFDPRMCLGLTALLDAGGGGKLNTLAIEFEEGHSSPSKVHAADVEANWNRLQKLLSGNGAISARAIKIWSDDGRRIGSRSAAAVFGALSDFIGYTDIVIDISAMPRGIYFPLIAKVLYL